ncbi:MAG: double-strand break repair helicase AddA [Pseudomonadota bacterium]|jgi:ATP-dependent helicase/nuclease subunit A
MTDLSAASQRQVEAALPTASTWLSANAGSGKTRVLTDRVARLLLGGVEPQHILCLTYTKAAASEMQNRLFRRLGEWAMKPDALLRAALAELGEGAGLDPDLLARARRLFARAIETPGGLRIQTIHSFCATLLRRFPLEAGVSPQFTELDDRAARLLREEIVQEMAETLHPTLMADVAAAWTGEDFATLMEQVAGQRHAFARGLDEAACRALFGLKPSDDVQSLLASVFLGDEGVWMPAVIAAMQAKGGNDGKAAAKLAAVSFAHPTIDGLCRLEGIFLGGADTKNPFIAKIDSFPTKDTRAALGATMDRLNALMARVETARPTRLALHAAAKAATLHRFAAAFLPLYEGRKAARGWLDFDDLITRARTVLTDPAVAAWVLFRLDGGIDHILVDEAQDTSPDQWAVIESLAAEFTAGSGARDENRTLFVVGDKKQSIYSFQGADVAAFDAKHGDFRDRFRTVGRPFQSLELEYSFRSSPAVLRVVDDTFGARFPQAMGDRVGHIAFRAAMAGRVDLWPPIPEAEADPKDDWENPVDHVTDSHHFAQLADRIADRIKGALDDGLVIPTENGDRPAHAGDFLILVQRRSMLFHEVIRACKARGLPIAGADRLKLGAELAVRDLRALLSFLGTDEDDLSLAAALRSPLFGWSEDRLYRLARPRKGRLWQALRDAQDDHRATFEMLSDLRDKADYLRPYELIDRILTRHQGRQRLLARLGAEAEDGIDELLSQALAYERMDVPSLTGFLIWLETDEVEVKRQADSEGHRIRVMTVHGAKGLEAPVVILPDCGDRTPQDRDEVIPVAGHPVWKVARNDRPAAMAQAMADRARRVEEENLRLLYVAMTRARVWLIVCAAGKVDKDDCWYRLAEQGMLAAGFDTLPDGTLRHAFGAWPAPVARVAAPPPAPIALPDWAARPAPAAPRAQPALSPSSLGGAKAIAGEGLDADTAMALGTALHLLLEHLPQAAPADRPALAAALLPDDATRPALLAEAEAILSRADLAFLFAPGTLAEVPLTAPFGDRALLGTIDRLVVESDRVLAVDFKSNRTLPATVDEVPEGILRQMGAYAHMLAQVYPGRRIDTAILWTRGPVLMPLPSDIVSAALARTTIP